MKDRCEDEIPLRRTARQAAGRPKKTETPAPPRIPRITRLMALAIKFQEMIDRGEVRDYADLARSSFVARERRQVCHVFRPRLVRKLEPGVCAVNCIRLGRHVPGE